MVNVARGARNLKNTGSAFRDRVGIARQAIVSNDSLLFLRSIRCSRIRMRNYTRCRNSWSRKLETPRFLYGFSYFEDLERNYGWGTGPESEATHWTVLDRRSRNEFSDIRM